MLTILAGTPSSRSMARLYSSEMNGYYNEAPAMYLAMMAGVATSPLIDHSEREIWDETHVLWFLQTHKYGLALSAMPRDRKY